LGDGWRRGGGGGAVGVGPVWSVKGGVGGSGEGGPGVRARAPPVRGINVGGKGRSLAGAVALKIDSFPSKWRKGAASFDQAGGGVAVLGRTAGGAIRGAAVSCPAGWGGSGGWRERGDAAGRGQRNSVAHSKQRVRDRSGRGAFRGQPEFGQHRNRWADL